ncbi:hypothetical protein OGAPHI_002428 [Ogataea philodendri]|uniref:Uncharacterized protein n=1 Tax=Ogataea philodendri TaxID=1378263 RepID=A0A9P8T7P6_9ASCO|nr:uncharacterized protein OGAPHI_002428 [Ogataea philodendri]KAH3668674.1 hypothetical protein OGAPHI_002428 [Ogataea philodendri]
MQQQAQDNPTSRQASPLRKLINQPPEPEPEPESASMSAQEVLSQLLGVQIESWPYSEESLEQLIQLKTEQERTRSEQSKSRNLELALELLNLARQVGISPDLIPFLFANVSPDDVRERVENTLKYHSPTPGYQTPRYRPEDSPAQSFSHRRSHTTSNIPSVGGATSVWKVNLPQQQQFQFHHWPGPGAVGPITSKGSSLDTTASSAQSATTSNLPYPNTPSAPSTSSPSYSAHKRKFSDPAQPTHHRQPSSPTKSHSLSLDKRRSINNPLASPYPYREPSYSASSYPPTQTTSVGPTSRFSQAASPYAARQQPPYYYSSPYHQQSYQFPTGKPQEPTLPPLRAPDDDKSKSKFLINTPKNPPK